MLHVKNTAIDYFKVDALSNSGIKRIIKSPAHFKLWTQQQQKTTDAMRIGTALHSYVLDGKRNFPIFSGETKTLNSKAGAAFLAYHPDGLTADEWMQVRSMGEAILGNPKMAKLMSGARKEVQIYGHTESESGRKIPVKAMLDAVTDTAILDIKTTSDFATDFIWSARKYSYDIQAAWYTKLSQEILDGKRRGFYFVVVESSAPYGVMLYEASDTYISQGLDKCLKGVEIYADCLEKNSWPCYSLDSIAVL